MRRRLTPRRREDSASCPPGSVRFRLHLVLAAVVTLAACGNAQNTSDVNPPYPHFVAFPESLSTPAKTVRLDDAPWFCSDHYRRIASPVLHFIDVSTARAKIGTMQRARVTDRATGWKLTLVGPVKIARDQVLFLVHPGNTERTGDQWDSIGRCKPLHFGRARDADRLGLPNSLHHLYYASDIGLYLVKP